MKAIMISVKASSPISSIKHVQPLTKWTMPCIPFVLYSLRICARRSTGDLPQLGRLGHFLKGSSASLGIIKLQHLCQNIQYYGNSKDESGTADIDPKEAKSRIERALSQARLEFAQAEQELASFYAGL